MICTVDATAPEPADIRFGQRDHDVTLFSVGAHVFSATSPSHAEPGGCSHGRTGR